MSTPVPPALGWILAALKAGMSLGEVAGKMMDADPWWTPERRAACDRFWRDECERRERQAEHWYPLRYYQEHGIELGSQWDILGALAARYARDLGTTELAAELDKIVAASPQLHGRGDRNGPWQRGHIWNIAARAREYIGREDQKEHEWWQRWGPGALRWIWKWTDGQEYETYRAWMRRSA